MILLGCLNALLYNLIHSLVIKVTSSVTTTVIGEMKIVLILLLSAVVLGEWTAQWLERTSGGIAAVEDQNEAGRFIPLPCPSLTVSPGESDVWTVKMMIGCTTAILGFCMYSHGRMMAGAQTVPVIIKGVPGACAA